MKLIREIASLVDIEVFRAQNETSPKLQKLLELICDEKNLSPTQIREQMMSGGYNKESFKQLTLRLKHKIVEHIAKNGTKNKSIDSDGIEYQKCMNQLSVVSVLNRSNSRKQAALLGEELLKTAIKNEYTEISLSVCRDLFIYYSTIDYDWKNVVKYERILLDTQRLYNRELEARHYLCLLRGRFEISRASLKEVLPIAVTYAEIVTNYIEDDCISYELLITSFQVIVIRYEIERNFKQLLTTCEEAINIFSTRRVTRKIAIYLFDRYRMFVYIQLRQYAEAESITARYLNAMTPGGLNWFNLVIYTIICRIHSRNYKGAARLAELVTNDHLIRLPKVTVEHWLVYHAHVQFLIASGKAAVMNPSTFRLNKFLNEIPIYSKDKKGLNISILIIQFLFLLQQRKYSQIIDRAEALNQYCYRYLKRDDTFRSNCFIRMLLQMPRADFNRIRTVRYADPYLQKLKSVPLMISEQSIEVEVIPYEDLWEITLELLD